MRVYPKINPGGKMCLSFLWNFIYIFRIFGALLETTEKFKEIPKKKKTNELRII